MVASERPDEAKKHDGGGTKPGTRKRRDADARLTDIKSLGCLSFYHILKEPSNHLIRGLEYNLIFKPVLIAKNYCLEEDIPHKGTSKSTL